MESFSGYEVIYQTLDVIEGLLELIRQDFISENDKYSLFVELVIAEAIVDSHRSIYNRDRAEELKVVRKEINVRLDKIRKEIFEFAKTLDLGRRKQILEEFGRQVSLSFISE